MAPKDAWDVRRRERAGRLILAHLLLDAAKGRRVGVRELGELLAAELGRASVQGSAVSRMESGEQDIDADFAIAVSRVCHRAGVSVDPGWLLCGPDTSAAAPTEASRPVSSLVPPQGRRGAQTVAPVRFAQAAKKPPKRRKSG